MKWSKVLILILFVSTVAIGVIVALAWVSNNKITTEKGFNRQFNIVNNASIVNTIIKREDITAIGGVSKNRIYFQTKNPNQLVSTDLELKNDTDIVFDFGKNQRLGTKFKYIVDSPLAYIFAGNVPAVIVVNIPTKEKKIYQFTNSLFSRGVPISKQTFAVRGFDSLIRTVDQIFMKFDPENSRLYKEDMVSERRNDGGISTDGVLQYDSTTNTLSYVFFYRNEFICMDTNLNVIYKTKTVDTFSILQAKSDSVYQNGDLTYTNTSPLRIINGDCCVDQGKLFINSWVKADNESVVNNSQNAVIDVYDLKNGTFAGSFYIPKFKNERMKGFKIVSNLIIVLYKNYIVTYKL